MNLTFHNVFTHAWSFVWRMVFTIVILFLLYALYLFATDDFEDHKAMAFCEAAFENSLNYAVQESSLRLLTEHDQLLRWLPPDYKPGVSLRNSTQRGVVSDFGTTDIETLSALPLRSVFFSPLGGVMAYESQRAREAGYSVYPYAPNTVAQKDVGWEEAFRRATALAILPEWSVMGRSSKTSTQEDQYVCSYAARGTSANPLLLLFRSMLSLGGASRNLDAEVTWVNHDGSFRPKSAMVHSEDFYQQAIYALSGHTDVSHETVDYVVNPDALARLQASLEKEKLQLPSTTQLKKFRFQAFVIQQRAPAKANVSPESGRIYKHNGVETSYTGDSVYERRNGEWKRIP